MVPRAATQALPLADPRHVVDPGGFDARVGLDGHQGATVARLYCIQLMATSAAFTNGYAMGEAVSAGCVPIWNMAMSSAVIRF